MKRRERRKERKEEIKKRMEKRKALFLVEFQSTYSRIYRKLRSLFDSTPLCATSYII